MSGGFDLQFHPQGREIDYWLGQIPTISPPSPYLGVGLNTDRCIRINVLMIQLILVQSPHFDFNINDILFSCAMGICTYCYVYYVNQGGGIPLQSVLQAVTTVKIKVNLKYSP